MKQDQTVDATDMTSIQKSLMKRWNHQMLEEKLNGNKFLPAALLRFIGANKSWFKVNAHLQEFMKFISAMKSDKLIPDETIVACLDVIRAKSVTPSGTMSPARPARSRPGSINGRLVRPSPRKGGGRTNLLQTPRQEELQYQLEARHDWATACSCGQQVDDPSQSVICSNPDCINPEFHMRCVGLVSRPVSWQCETCSSSGASRFKSRKRDWRGAF